MKKILIALFITLACGKTFAEPAGGFIPQIPPIYAHPDVVEYAIKKYVVAPYDPNKVTAAYEQYMNQNDGTITLENLQQKVCPAGGMDKTRCKEFTDALMIYYYDVCDNEKGKSRKKEHCVNKDFFSNIVGTALNISGTHVRIKEAIGLAQEYALIKDNQKVVCISNKAKSKKTNTIWCTSLDQEHFYEFKFNDIHETIDADISDSLLAAVCKIHSTEYRTSGVNPGTIVNPSYSWPSSCLTKDKQICTNINKSLSRFSYKSEIGSVRNDANPSSSFSSCVISQIISETSDLRTAYGIDNTVFKDVQYVAGEETDKQIKNYVRQQLQKQKIPFDERGFYCADSTNIIHGLNPKEIQTCYVNGKPIDFVFADLSESNERSRESGLSKMACVQLGGKVDQKNCRGLKEQECETLGNRLVARGEKGTKYLSEKGGCVLSAAVAEYTEKLIKEIVAGVVLTLVTEGTATWPVIISIGTDLAFEDIQIWQDRIPYKDFKEFIAATDECEQIAKGDIIGDDPISDIKKWCMGNVLYQYSALMTSEMKDLAPDVQEQLFYKIEQIVSVVGDKSIAYVDKSKISIDKKIRNFASFSLFGMLLIFKPETWFSKSKRMLAEFTQLQLKASSRFGTYMNDLITQGKRKMLDPDRLSFEEWDKLNGYLSPYGVKLKNYVDNNNIHWKVFTKTIDRSDVFAKVYDNMPNEVIIEKFNYVAKNSATKYDAIDALIKTGIYDPDVAKEMGVDLARAFLQELSTMPEAKKVLMEGLQHWKKQSLESRICLIEFVHNIFTSLRRQRTYKTIVNCKVLPEHKHGSYQLEDGKNIFEYNIDRNDVIEVLRTIFHENTHLYQGLGRTTIPQPFISWSNVNYVDPKINYEYYKKQIIEQEARDVGKTVASIVAEALGL
ncbi:MAG: hypothetical protein J6Y07_02305 [Alphaproteobacteria bacterium]|nr:hypothetical protein [Alphaproteobacteria bacterium]